MHQRWYRAYERGRPGYPREVTAVSGLPRAGHVLDLAAGTGKLTRLLVPNFGRVVAVEPDDEMRRRLVALCSDANALAGSAEHIPLAGDSVDGVFAAQCFHLVDREQALAEIARVLQPGGTLVLLWNVQAGQPDPSIAPVEQLLDRHWPKGWDPLDLGDPIPYARDDWQVQFTSAGFEALDQVELPNPQTVDRERARRVHELDGLDCHPARRRAPFTARDGEVAAHVRPIRAAVGNTPLLGTTAADGRITIIALDVHAVGRCGDHVRTDRRLGLCVG